MNEKEDSGDLQKPVAELSSISEDEKTFKGVIRWNVSNSDIEKHLKSVGKCIKSPTFSIGSPSYCSFHFLLYPNGKNESGGGYASVSIIFNGKLPESSWIKGKIDISEFLPMKTFTFSVCGKDTGGVVDLNDLCHTSHLKEYISFEDLDRTVRCSIKIKVKEVKCVFDKETVQYVESRDYDLCKDSVTRELFSDVTISVDGHEIKTHKSILAQVPYFQVLFDADESKQRFDLTNINYSTFVHVLDFLYTKDIPMLHFKLACELYIVASDLKIFDLRNMCSSYLGANLTENNVFIVVKLSHECDDTALKTECIKFIKNSNVETLAEKSMVL